MRYSVTGAFKILNNNCSSKAPTTELAWFKSLESKITLISVHGLVQNSSAEKVQLFYNSMCMTT